MEFQHRDTFLLLEDVIYTSLSEQPISLDNNIRSFRPE